MLDLSLLRESMAWGARGRYLGMTSERAFAGASAVGNLVGDQGLQPQVGEKSKAGCLVQRGPQRGGEEITPIKANE